MDWKDEETISSFYKSLLKCGREVATAESYCRDVKGFLKYLQEFKYQVHAIEPLLLLSYQEQLWEKKIKTNTIRRAIIGIKQYFRYLNEVNIISSYPFEEIPLPQRDENIKIKIEHVDILKLISEASSQSYKTKGCRDAALISLLSFEGIKISEIINLKWPDFLVNRHLGSIRIKGTRARVVQLCNKSTKWLLDYQKELKENFPPDQYHDLYEKMFLGFKGRDLRPHPQLTRHGLKFMLYELGNVIMIDKLNSENLRHYAIQYHLYLGRTPEEIMEHFGLRRIGNIAKHLSKKTVQSGGFIKYLPNDI